MRVRVLGCSGGCAPARNPSCYMLEDGILVDAGAMATALTVEEQQSIQHVLLTHAHWDHCRDLPLSVINRTTQTPTLQLWGIPETLDAVREHLMNAKTWFKAFELPTVETPFIAANTFRPGDDVKIGRYRVRGMLVPHTVPAISYIIDDGECSVIINGDTGGGGIFKNLPKDMSPLKAVFLEASFPNRMKDFAVMTGHLTPRMLLDEVSCLDDEVDVIVTHLKPGFEVEMAEELADLGRRGVRPCRDGDVYRW